MENPKVELEYRVVPITRYAVTRYTDNERGGSVEGRGEYNNSDVAHEVAYALCKLEHDKLGWEPGDMRILYPHKPLPEAIPA